MELPFAHNLAQLAQLGHAPAGLVALVFLGPVWTGVFKAMVQQFNQGSVQSRRKTQGDVGWLLPARIRNPIVLDGKLLLRVKGNDRAAVTEGLPVEHHLHFNASAQPGLVLDNVLAVRLSCSWFSYYHTPPSIHALKAFKFLPDPL